jgi:diguanylate cyclase (GGDEF)-like protein
MLLERDKIESYKILSVEDDPDMAAFIKLTLSSAGYTVLHIADPKTFEEQFLSFEPDLVMLDVLLGDLTGFELAKYIRQNDRFATLPIVFLTTQNKLHQHLRSAISGGDEHLIKPVAPQLLIVTVASRLERARALKRLIDRDGLTRCLNFGSFMERAQKLAVLDGFRSAPAMMMIDVDNMKKINEQLGFAAGDRIIANIANMLLKGFRNTDLIARFANDQFAIVLEHLNQQQLHELSSQVLKAISSTAQMVKGRPVYITCSGGVAVLEQGMSVQDWQNAAQDALDKAKASGGNRALLRPRN